DDQYRHEDQRGAHPAFRRPHAQPMCNATATADSREVERLECAARPGWGAGVPVAARAPHGPDMSAEKTEPAWNRTRDQTDERPTRVVSTSKTRAAAPNGLARYPEAPAESAA